MEIIKTRKSVFHKKNKKFDIILIHNSDKIK
jgi:hypothetical protein